MQLKTSQSHTGALHFHVLHPASFPGPLTQQACCRGQPESSWRARKSLNLHHFWEVIVHEDHVGSLFADVCPRLSHRDPDIRGFQGHGVVDTVPCHWHHSTSPLQGLWEGRGQRLSSRQTHKSCWQFQSLYSLLCSFYIERSEVLFGSEGKRDLASHRGQNSDQELGGCFFRSVGNLTTPAEVRRGE